jgi:hypothetical protein
VMVREWNVVAFWISIWRIFPHQEKGPFSLHGLFFFFADISTFYFNLNKD